MSIGIVPSLFLYLLFCVWFTYTCVLGDPATSPMVQLFTVKIPTLFLANLKKIPIVGPKAIQIIHKISDKFLVIIYLTVVLGAWSVMFTYGYTFISHSKHVSSYHKLSGYIVFVACMSSWRKAGTHRPGYITESNLPKYDSYPYDDLLYVARNCSTLGFRKAARSKYDRYTNCHVARFDHYCGWIDNTVGEENYRFFLLFLAVHVGMCFYGTIVTLALFRGEIADRNMWNAVFYNGSTGQEVHADLWVICHYFFMRHFALAAVFLLMGVMAVALGLFMMFHLYLVANGMTTNEYYKWRQVKRWHKREKAKYDAAVKKGKVTQNIPTKNTNGGVEGSSKKDIDVMPDVDVGCVGPTGTTGYENRPTNTRINEHDVMDPGPFPPNIYNLGIVENFKEVISPRSLRADARARLAAAATARSGKFGVSDHAKNGFGADCAQPSAAKTKSS